MPRRTNDFQTLIALIERQIAQPGVTVTESKLVTDVVIRQDREVDVHLVVNDGQDTTTVGIECVAEQRRADITWVEGKIQKHRDLGTDRLVLVSRSGFTNSARKKAKQHGAITMTVEQATAAEWASLPKSTLSLRVGGMRLVTVGIAVPYDSQLDVEVPKGEPPLGPDLLQVVLYAPNGDQLGTVKEILEQAKSAPYIIEEFERQAPRHGDEAPLRLDVRFAAGCYWLDEHGQRHGIVRLSLRGVGRLQKEEIPIGRARYGQTLVLSGAANVGGSRMVVAGVHPSDTRFSVGISPAPGSEPLIFELEITRGSESEGTALPSPGTT